jgi:hypothetical protein
MELERRMIYLASPYSHENPDVQEARFKAVCLVAAKLIGRGHMIFSPIAHSHPIALHGLAGDWQTWRAFDLAMIDACKEVWMLLLPGWGKSEGMRDEEEYAMSLGKPVRYLHADGEFALDVPETTR